MFYGGLTGFGGGHSVSYEGLMDDIASNGLLANLEICIDVAAASCWDDGVDSQTLFDMSGNGYDFHLGAGAGSSTDDPTFNGTVGDLSSSEYFSFDGGDFFTINSMPASIQAMHADGADYTIFHVWYLANNAAAAYLCGDGAIGSNRGTNVNWESDEKYQINVWGAGSQYKQTDAGQFSTLPGWKALANSINEEGGSVSFFRRTDADAQEAYLNVSSATTFDFAFSGSASAAAYDFAIGARASGQNPTLSTSRFAMFALWSESLTAGQIDSILTSASVSTRFSL